MDNYGTLHEANGRYVLRFERFFTHDVEEVFYILTSPSHFTQWYPFATGNMDLKVGGKIFLDDGEGMKYEAVITEYDPPYLFSFREVNDLIEISLEEDEKGCHMTFVHTFDDPSWAVNTATGWHRCLDVFSNMVHGSPIEWDDNTEKLKKVYRKKFTKSV